MELEFPRLVYKSADKHTVADNQEEFDALLADGWYASVPEALEAANKAEQSDEPAAPAAPVVAKPAAKQTKAKTK